MSLCIIYRSCLPRLREAAPVFYVMLFVGYSWCLKVLLYSFLEQLQILYNTPCKEVTAVCKLHACSICTMHIREKYWSSGRIQEYPEIILLPFFTGKTAT